jgi:hypothetical protein
MLFRTVALAAATLLCALTASAQTFSTHTYSNNNLWSLNEGPNGHIRADLNGDGREDFISENDASFNSGCTGSFAVTLSTGDGSYAAPTCYTIPSGVALYFAVGDFWGWGTVPILDLAVTNDNGQIFIYRNNGAGQLAYKETINLSSEASGIVAADVNHDGHTDLVYDASDRSTGASTLNVLLNQGSSGLPPAFTPGPITDFNMNKEPAGALAVGDFDSDGHADILVLGASQVRNEILYGDGQGDFTPGPIVGGSTTQYAPFDINSNGTMDLIGAPFQANPLGANTYYNYLDIEWSHTNRTLTSQHVQLTSCTDGGAPPQVADFDGDGIKDIVVAEAADCQGNAPYTLNFMKGNANGTFQPEKVIYSTNDWIAEWHVMRASHSSKPDLTVWQAQLFQREISNAEQLVLVNTTSGAFPTCTPLNFSSTGIDNCGPTSSVGATSPVTFNFAGSNQTPGRDMELWIDGKKVDQQFNQSYSYDDFLQYCAALSDGEHHVALYTVDWDYSLLKELRYWFTLTVGSDTCPLPSNEDLNVCSPFCSGNPNVGSPLQNSTLPASQPVTAYARGEAPSGQAIARMEVWVDGVKKYTTYGSNSLKTSFSLPAGPHTFAYYVVDTNGTTTEDKFNVTVQ